MVSRSSFGPLSFSRSRSRSPLKGPTPVLKVEPTGR